MLLFLPHGEAIPPEDVDRQSDPAPGGRGERILVIEDNDELRALAVRMLKGLGYRVEAVSDAFAERRSLERDEEVDLMLSDVVLPGGLSGAELARQLAVSRPELKVVFMSGYPSAGACDGSTAADGNEILMKPFGKNDLAAILRRALGG